jgi:ABC-type glycerol-3-phosphate transport system permease component
MESNEVVATITVPSRPAYRRQWRFVLRRIALRTIAYLVAIAFGLTALLPFLWTISTSLKDGTQVLAIPPSWIPDPAHWENYTTVVNLEFMPGQKLFVRWLGNSTLIVLLNLFGEIVCACAAGYGFARFRFPGKNLLFTLMLASMMLPWVVRIVPMYLLFYQLGWLNTYLPLTIPNWIGGAYLTFFMRQYFVTIPKDLDDAAEIDGANSVHIFLRIMLPLAAPAIATAAILVFSSNWNNFFEPLIFLNDIEKFVLAVGLRWYQIQGFSGGAKQPLVSAFALIMAAPTILLFFAAQRYFVRGIKLSASKE